MTIAHFCGICGMSHTYKGDHGQPGVLDLFCLQLLQVYGSVNSFENHQGMHNLMCQLPSSYSLVSCAGIA